MFISCEIRQCVQTPGKRIISYVKGRRLEFVSMSDDIYLGGIFPFLLSKLSLRTSKRGKQMGDLKWQNTKIRKTMN